MAVSYSTEFFKWLMYVFAVTIAAMATWWTNESFHAQFTSNIISASSVALANSQQLLALRVQMVQYCEGTNSPNVSVVNACDALLSEWHTNVDDITAAIAQGNSTYIMSLVPPFYEITTAIPKRIDPSGRHTGSRVGLRFVIVVSCLLGISTFIVFLLGGFADLADRIFEPSHVCERLR